LSYKIVGVVKMEASLVMLLVSLLVFTFLIAIDATSVVLAVTVSVLRVQSKRAVQMCSPCSAGT
jgi:hypothetical protein